jgi:hypothetical protein
MQFRWRPLWFFSPALAVTLSHFQRALWVRSLQLSGRSRKMWNIGNTNKLPNTTPRHERRRLCDLFIHYFLCPHRLSCPKRLLFNDGRASFQAVSLPGCEAKHLSLSSTKVKNEWSDISTFNIHGTVHRNMTRSKSPTRCNSVTEFLLFHLRQ